jgi:phenylpyruvate tautomerase PptA (4-oxalocrotonate tautomerase family)
LTKDADIIGGERKRDTMPMIDVYAAAGTFGDQHALAQNLAAELMTIEQVPDIPMFRKNTAAFIHELPSSGLSNVDGDTTYVRVQVLTNAGALDREKQLAVVSRLTALVAEAAGDPSLAERTWVLLTEAPDGGWGLAGHANTNEELVAAARAQIAELQGRKPGG